MVKRVKRFEGGGDIEAESFPRSTYERVGKSALEEGEEIFQKELAKRQEKTSTSPSRKTIDYGDETQRLMSRRTPMRDAGTVPVGAEEAAPRADMRPQARQPSTAERMIEALPAGAAGIGLGAMAGRALAARRLAQNVEAGKAAAQARSMEALKRATEARSAARSAAKEAEAGKDAARMAEEGGMRYGRGAPQPSKTMRSAAKETESGGNASRLSREETGRRMKERGEPRDKGVSFGFKKGGAVSASRRADGIAQRGKTKGRLY